MNDSKKTLTHLISKKFHINPKLKPITITSNDLIYRGEVNEEKVLPINVYPVKVKPEMYKDNIIYAKTSGDDYIIQPKYFLYSGSSCLTEFYSKKLRVKLVNELLAMDDFCSGKDFYEYFKKKKDLRTEKRRGGILIRKFPASVELSHLISSPKTKNGQFFSSAQRNFNKNAAKFNLISKMTSNFSRIMKRSPQWKRRLKYEKKYLSTIPIDEFSTLIRAKSLPKHKANNFSICTNKTLPQLKPLKPPKFLKALEESHLKIDDFPSFLNYNTPQNSSNVSTIFKSKLSPLKMNLIGKYNSVISGCNKYLSNYSEYENEIDNINKSFHLQFKIRKQINMFDPISPALKGIKINK